VSEPDLDSPAPSLRRGPLGAHVATEIASWIVTGGRRSGDPLPAEAELAARYGVSVRVVRDALRVLSSQGVIQTSQGRRAVVANRPSEAVEGYFKFATASDRAAIGELFEVRIALETRAAALAADRRDAESSARIEAALEAMRASAAEIEGYADADLGWHAAVVEASGNRFLVGIHTALAQILRTERISGATMRFRAGDTAERTLDEHAAITTAIARGDRPAAEAAMRAHLERARTLYEAYLALGETG
jgi:DNA-binding FadR family transcriptional regulator